jgi:hypothetical protein
MSIRIRRTKAVALPLLMLLASLAVAACGSSSHGSSSSANTAASATTSTANAAASATTSTATTSTAPGQQAGGRFAALPECLRKNGVPLPQPRPGAQPGTSGLFSGGSAVRLPPGVTPARYQAALKKCGAAKIANRLGRARARVPRGELLKNPASKQALTSFVACMGDHGVKLPAPNTSGRGSVFNTKGVNTKSSQFTAALSMCRSGLARAFGRGGPVSSSAG